MPQAGAQQSRISVEGAIDITQEQQQFVDRFVAASRQHDTAPFWDLILPASRACMSDDEKKVSEMMDFGHTMEQPVPDDYYTQVTEVKADEMADFYHMMYGSSAKAPAVPTHMIMVNFEGRAGVCPATNVSKIMYVTEQDGTWYQVLPCHTSLPMSADELAAKMDADKEKAAAQFAGLSDETKAKVRDLLVNGGSKIEAMKTIAAELGVSLGETRSVIDKFCEKTD